MLPNKIDYSFPAQKKSLNLKHEIWRRQCVDSGEQACLWRNEGVRTSAHNKKINYDLYSDILDQRDVEKVCNPMGIAGFQAPAKMQNYPICNPKIDLLVGESIARKSEYRVRVMNSDAISEKGKNAMKLFNQLVMSHLKNKNLSEEELEKELKDFDYFLKYDYQEAKEAIASDIVNYLYQHLNLDYIFAKGFKDALIASEEIYQTDVIGGEPIIKRLNPKNVHTVRSGESPYVEDSDIITIVNYYSPGQIIDEYHDELTPAEIDRITLGMSGSVTSVKNGIDIGRKPELPLFPDEGISISMLANDFAYGSPFDNDGNIKVTKVYWKSLRKVFKVKYYDEQGDPQFDIRDEFYKIDKSKGEEAKVLWISEWWEGHKIGGSIGDVDNDAIYLRMRPKPVQFRNLENPSVCHPGIVGTVYNTNDNKGVSLMDRMKPLNYLYNIMAYNVELMVAKNKGKISRVNLAEIPEGWKLDKWLSYVTAMNISFYDPFREGNKGASKGKLAGSLNQGASVLDAEMGNSIQMYMNVMAFIKQEIGEISGVSAARQGQIHNRSAVGNVQQELNQTSHITEYWFMEHDLTKKRAIECLLETAKYAWRDKGNKKAQFILGDGKTKLLSIDVKDFSDAEYGLMLVNGNNYYELLNNMKQIAGQSVAAGQMKFSQLLDIWSESSLSTIRRKFVENEERAEANAQQSEKIKKDIAEKQMQQLTEEKEKDREFVREEWDREDARLDKELQAKISEYSKEDLAIEKNISLESLKLQAQKLQKEFMLKSKEIEEKIRSNKASEKIKEKEIKNKNRQI